MLRHSLLSVFLAWALAPLAAQSPPQWRWLATEHLGCLTPRAELAAVGLAGTDLGVSFPCGDRLMFLFGDSWTLDQKERDADAAAWLPLSPPASDAPPPLRWFTRKGGRFAIVAPAGTQLGGMNVPVEGITIGDRTFVFFDDGWHAGKGRHSHSICAVAKGKDLEQLELRHRAATGKFVNVSIASEGDTLWIFGTGHYRKSSVFLARVAAAELDNRDAWRYWPDFGPDEAAARPIVHSDCIGELSVRRLPGSPLWWMTCNAALPRGIHLRTAAAPTGPWSDPIVVFDPSRDRGYGHTMHQKFSSVGYDDGLSEPGRDEEWAGEYGPYLVPEWCSSPSPGVMQLVYTLSTWNPYAVRLLRSTVCTGDAVWQPQPAPAPAPANVKLPKNLGFEKGKTTGWKQDGDEFVTGQRPDGIWFVCSWVAPRADAVQGRLWQEFTVSETARELRGVVWGGSEAVQLLLDDEVVRCTRGRRTNDVQVPIRWRLDEFRGKRVRLEIVDRSTAGWGFVSVSGLELID